jgi:hypothetical protein
VRRLCATALLVLTALLGVDPRPAGRGSTAAVSPLVSSARGRGKGGGNEAASLDSASLAAGLLGATKSSTRLRRSSLPCSSLRAPAPLLTSLCSLSHSLLYAPPRFFAAGPDRQTAWAHRRRLESQSKPKSSLSPDPHGRTGGEGMCAHAGQGDTPPGSSAVSWLP